MFCVLNKYTSVLRRFSSEILAQYILEMRRGQRLLSVTGSALRMFHSVVYFLDAPASLRRDPYWSHELNVFEIA